MQQLTQAGQNLVNDLAYRYNLSQDAVVHMLVAVNNGNGTMAQFNCPELGGSGQWMQGGMTMVGDMFNHGLKMTVDNLCSELSAALANTQIFPPVPRGTRLSQNWWPAELGSPFSSGSQNNVRYAIFPNRLAVESNGQVSVYDTLNHNIGGVSQQQGGGDSLTFSSQFGTVAVSSLPLISGPGQAYAPQTNFAAPPQQQQQPEPQPQPEPPQPQPEPQPQPQQTDTQAAVPGLSGGASTDDIIGMIEKLARLRDAGALTDEEFNAKKVELLQRI